MTDTREVFAIISSRTGQHVFEFEDREHAISHYGSEAAMYQSMKDNHQWADFVQKRVD